MNLTFEFPPPIPSDIHARIADARRSSEISNCARAVLDILAGQDPHMGQNSAISIAMMQRKWRQHGSTVWSDRTVKAAVKSLLEVHDVPVGASRSATRPGYFVCVTDQDCELAIRHRLSEAKSILKGCQKLSPKSHYVRGLLGQLEMGGEQ